MKSGLSLSALICLVMITAPLHAEEGYLNVTELPEIAVWLPAAPSDGSVQEASDLERYFATRSLVGLARGEEAVRDNVYDPRDVIGRFQNAMGFELSPSNSPRLFAMMDRVMRDEERMLKPVKKPIAEGGRVRPYVRFEALASCPHERDDRLWHLAASGSYPSGHAMLGWTWALLLAEALPEQADEIFATGYSFGESRLVCGFHYPSDLQAGRLASSALVARLHADLEFSEDWAIARQEIDRARPSISSD